MDDDRIDPDHPAALAYAVKHARRHEEYEAGAMQKPGMGSGGPSQPIDAEDVLQALPAQIRELAYMPLIELIQRFGTADAMRDYLEAVKVIEMIISKRLANAREEGDLVNRELVLRGVVEPFNSTHARLMTDGARVIARKLYAMALAGKTVKEGEVYASDRIGAFIKAAKAKAEQVMSANR